MAGNEQSDVVRMIGDVLTELDVVLASPDLSEPDFQQLRKLRRALDKLQLQIVAKEFRENTQKFRDAADSLDQVNTVLAQTISDVTRVATTIASITKFISSAEKLLSIAIS